MCEANACRQLCEAAGAGGGFLGGVGFWRGGIDSGCVVFLIVEVFV